MPVKVCCGIASYDPSLWVESTEDQPGVHVIEGPLEHVVKFNEKMCRYEGVLHVFVEPNIRLALRTMMVRGFFGRSRMKTASFLACVRNVARRSPCLKRV